ncbi:MAG: alkylhydroperoxidase [Betaproteobacteria bacterium RIFCSPLOWO2_02_FULL_64_12]|nr:MAG: alkylhydroperoxidase [Betaproteobacteria bacterium RIFCSPLOWO2_02_FULL_64_12]
MAKKNGPQSRVYVGLRKRHPKAFAAIENLGRAIRNEGPLDERLSHLVQLAASAAIRSEGAVHSHARRALEAGATPAEVHHALLLLTSTIGFPNVVAAISWADDVMRKPR